MQAMWGAWQGTAWTCPALLSWQAYPQQPAMADGLCQLQPLTACPRRGTRSWAVSPPLTKPLPLLSGDRVNESKRLPPSGAWHRERKHHRALLPAYPWLSGSAPWESVPACLVFQGSGLGRGEEWLLGEHRQPPSLPKWSWRDGILPCPSCGCVSAG